MVKFLDFLLAAFNLPKNVINFMDRINGDTHRQAATGGSNTLMLRCLAFHVTATSQLLRDVNKFLLAYVILFKRVNFLQHFICFW